MIVATDVEVLLDKQGECQLVGRLHRQPGRGREIVSFQYDENWIAATDNFSVDASSIVGRGNFFPPVGREMFGCLGDCAPDQWGRRLMRRAERRRAEQEQRKPRTLFETDYLLGVADKPRLGALRFRFAGDNIYEK